MLGSVLHRIGVGLDVAKLESGGFKEYRRAPTAAENVYNQLIREKRALSAKKVKTDADVKRLDESRAIEPAKSEAALAAIRNSQSPVLRSFTDKLQANADVKQTFDPWEMDVETGDKIPALPNRLATGNEKLHRNHLHITVRDVELGP